LVTPRTVPEMALRALSFINVSTTSRCYEK
jgi:hypothetical protein